MDYKLIYLARRNPAVSPEDWPRAWRSHAVFASQFPVIGAKISSLFYCSRVFEPTLDGATFAPPGASTRYDGVAVVASPSADSLDGEMSDADRARIFEDELGVFAENTPAFSFRCRESLVEGGTPGGAAVIRFLARRSELDAAAFQARWSGHAGLAFGAVRYVQNALIEPPPAGYPFDGIEETWFANVEDATRAFTRPEFLPGDLAEFCDEDCSVTLLTQVIHRWPRG